MDDALDVELHDAVLIDEMRLVTELMVVASLAPGELEQAVIDNALGVEHLYPRLPSQRRAAEAAARPPRSPAAYTGAAHGDEEDIDGTAGPDHRPT
jgi:hypothetical protein